MAAFVCPTCGFANEPTDEDTGDSTKCTWCGADPSKPTKSTPQWPPTQFPEPKESKRSLEPWKNEILMVAALGLAAAIIFLIVSIGFNPGKTPLHELVTEEVDKEILAVGMSALEDYGWTEPETAGYIEKRVRVYKVENQRARNMSELVRARDQLTVRATASDIENFSKSDRRKAEEKIEEREAMIKEFERILVAYRQAPKSEQ
jgi:hypothetical protein